MLENFKEYQNKANIYYAYHTIQRYTDEPFTSYMPEALFNISRFVHIFFSWNQYLFRVFFRETNICLVFFRETKFFVYIFIQHF